MIRSLIYLVNRVVFLQAFSRKGKNGTMQSNVNDFKLWPTKLTRIKSQFYLVIFQTKLLLMKMNKCIINSSAVSRYWYSYNFNRNRNRVVFGYMLKLPANFLKLVQWELSKFLFIEGCRQGLEKEPWIKALSYTIVPGKFI